MKKREHERLPLQLTSAKIDAITFRFTCSNMNCAWAICTVNDVTGELLITSDCGNWAHRWNVDHTGCATLLHFIADRKACHYLADKLTSTSEREVFDPERTVKSLKETVRERRREERIDAAEARDLYTALRAIDHERDMRDFVSAVYQIDGYEKITREPYERLVMTPSVTYFVLLNSILPALVDAAAEYMKTSERHIAAHAVWKVKRDEEAAKYKADQAAKAAAAGAVA